ncbi:MAG: porin family protein, partial [Bacteroidota bacterium]
MIFSTAKRSFIGLSLILLTHSFSFAQTRFNFFAGPQISTTNYIVGGEKQSNSFKPGFQLGIGAKIEFESHLFFSPSVYYSLKGYKVTLDKASSPPDMTAINNNVTVHTLETAFLLQYDFTKDPSHFYIKLGPSLDFQLLGKEKFDRVNGDKVSRNMKYDFANYGRYAASGVLHTGYEMSNSLFFYAY